MFTRFLQSLTHTLPGKPILPVNTIPDDDCNQSVVTAIPSENCATDNQLATNAISIAIVPIDVRSIVIDIPSDNGLSQRQRTNGVEDAYKLSKEQPRQVLKGMPVASSQKTIAVTHSPGNDHYLKDNAQTRKDAYSQTIEEAVTVVAGSLDNSQGNEDNALNQKTDDESVGRFYCPYKGCEHSRKSRSDIIHHARKRHNANIPRLPTRSIYTLKSGRIEVRFNKDSRGTLEDGDTIVLVKVAASPSNENLFCPYKGCNSKFARKANVYKHIRAYHCSTFHHLPSGNRYVIKTSSGKTICFDENSRNIFSQGEAPIIVEDNVSKPFCCPYQECIKQYTTRGNVFHHIRSKHDFQFPLIRQRRYSEGAFRTLSGEVINFDASSRNKLGVNERIVIAKEPFTIPEQ